MRLRKRYLPAGVVHSHQTVIEICTRLVRSQISHMAFKRMKIKALDEPRILRSKRKWQAPHRHQTGGPHNGGSAQQRG